MIAEKIKKRVTRTVSLLTLGFFLFSQVAFAGPGVGIEIAANRETPGFLRIDIPTELASLDGIWEAPPSLNSKFILHIQNAHANYGAQKKIKELLEYLNKTYAIKTVFVEDAAEDLNPDFLKLFPDKARNLELADLLAQQGELTGAELYLLETGDTTFRGKGIEDAGLYRNNYEALKKVFGSEVLVNRYLKGYEARLDALSSKIFTDDLRGVLADWKKFENGRREFMPFVRTLAVDSKRFLKLDLESLFSQVEWPQITRLLVLQGMEKELDTAKALEEKEKLLSFLKAKGVSPRIIAEVENFKEQRLNVRQGQGEAMQPRDALEALIKEAGPKGFYFRDYPAFSLYAGYLILKSELDAKGLFEEINVLFEKILDSLAVTPGQKTLLELYRDEQYARKLLSLELSRKDLQLALGRKTQIEMDSLISRLKELSKVVTKEMNLTPSDLEVKTLSPKFREQVLELYNAAFNFYDFARQRETVFYEKIDSAMSQGGTSKAILITGGFHTDGMTDLFREHNVSYGILTPRLMEKSDEKAYRNTMLQNEQQLFSISYLERALFADLKTLETMGFSFSKELSPIIKNFRGLLDKGSRDGPSVARLFNESISARALRVKLTYVGKGANGGDRFKLYVSKVSELTELKGKQIGTMVPVETPGAEALFATRGQIDDAVKALAGRAQPTKKRAAVTSAKDLARGLEQVAKTTAAVTKTNEARALETVLAVAKVKAAVKNAAKKAGVPVDAFAAAVAVARSEHRDNGVGEDLAIDNSETYIQRGEAANVLTPAELAARDEGPSFGPSSTSVVAEEPSGGAVDAEEAQRQGMIDETLKRSNETTPADLREDPAAMARSETRLPPSVTKWVPRALGLGAGYLVFRILFSLATREFGFSAPAGMVEPTAHLTASLLNIIIAYPFSAFWSSVGAVFAAWLVWAVSSAVFETREDSRRNRELGIGRKSRSEVRVYEDGTKAIFPEFAEQPRDTVFKMIDSLSKTLPEGDTSLDAIAKLLVGALNSDQREAVTRILDQNDKAVLKRVIFMAEDRLADLSLKFNETGTGVRVTRQTVAFKTRADLEKELVGKKVVFIGGSSNTVENFEQSAGLIEKLINEIYNQNPNAVIMLGTAGFGIPYLVKRYAQQKGLIVVEVVPEQYKNWAGKGENIVRGVVGTDWDSEDHFAGIASLASAVFIVDGYGASEREYQAFEDLKSRATRLMSKELPSDDILSVTVRLSLDVPETAEEFVKILGSRNAIVANLNESLVRAIAAKWDEKDLAMVERLLRNEITAYQALAELKKANKAAMADFDQKNGKNESLKKDLTVNPHTAWFNDEVRNKPSLIIYSQVLHNILVKYIKLGKIKGADGQPLTLQDFENPKGKFKFAPGSFIDAAALDQFKADLGAAGIKVSPEGAFEINTVAAPMDVLESIVPSIASDKASEAYKTWLRARKDRLYQLQRDSAEPVIVSISYGDLLKRLQSKDPAEVAIAFVDLMRAVNIGWRLNNAWKVSNVVKDAAAIRLFSNAFGLNEKDGFGVKGESGIGMEDIVKDGTAALEILLALYKNNADFGTAAVNQMFRAAMEGGMAEQLRSLLAEKARLAEAVRESSRRLQDEKYAAGRPNTIREFSRTFASSEEMNSRVGRTAWQALGDTNKAENERLMRAQSHLKIVLAGIEAANDATMARFEGANKDATVGDQPLLVTLSDNPHESWRADMENNQGKNYIAYGAKLHEFLAKLVEQGKVKDRNGKVLTLAEFEHPQKKFKIFVGGQKDHHVEIGKEEEALFVEEINGVTGKGFTAETVTKFFANTVMGTKSQLAGVKVKTQYVQVKNQKGKMVIIPKAEDKEGKGTDINWQEVRARYLAGLQRPSVGSVLSGLMDDPLLAELKAPALPNQPAEDLAKQKLVTLVKFMRKINLGWRLNNPWNGYDDDLIHKAFELDEGPYKGKAIGLRVIMQDGVVLRAVLEALFQSKDVVLPSGVKEAINDAFNLGGLGKAFDLMVDPEAVRNAVIATREEEQFTVASALARAATPVVARSEIRDEGVVRMIPVQLAGLTQSISKADKAGDKEEAETLRQDRLRLAMRLVESRITNPFIAYVVGRYLESNNPTDIQQKIFRGGKSALKEIGRIEAVSKYAEGGATGWADDPTLGHNNAQAIALEKMILMGHSGFFSEAERVLTTQGDPFKPENGLKEKRLADDSKFGKAVGTDGQIDENQERENVRGVLGEARALLPALNLLLQYIAVKAGLLEEDREISSRPKGEQSTINKINKFRAHPEWGDWAKNATIADLFDLLGGRIVVSDLVALENLMKRVEEIFGFKIEITRDAQGKPITAAVAGGDVLRKENKFVTSSRVRLKDLEKMAKDGTLSAEELGKIRNLADAGKTVGFSDLVTMAESGNLSSQAYGIILSTADPYRAIQYTIRFPDQNKLEQLVRDAGKELGMSEEGIQAIVDQTKTVKDTGSHTFELQIKTERGSTASDLFHDSVYKDLMNLLGELKKIVKDYNWNSFYEDTLIYGLKKGLVRAEDLEKEKIRKLLKEKGMPDEEIEEYFKNYMNPTEDIANAANAFVELWASGRPGPRDAAYEKRLQTAVVNAVLAGDVTRFYDLVESQYSFRDTLPVPVRQLKHFFANRRQLMIVLVKKEHPAAVAPHEDAAHNSYINSAVKDDLEATGGQLGWRLSPAAEAMLTPEARAIYMDRFNTFKSRGTKLSVEDLQLHLLSDEQLYAFFQASGKTFDRAKVEALVAQIRAENPDAQGMKKIFKGQKANGAEQLIAKIMFYREDSDAVRQQRITLKVVNLFHASRQEQTDVARNPGNPFYIRDEALRKEWLKRLDTNQLGAVVSASTITEIAYGPVRDLDGNVVMQKDPATGAESPKMRDMSQIVLKTESGEEYTLREMMVFWTFISFINPGSEFADFSYEKFVTSPNSEWARKIDVAMDQAIMISLVKSQLEVLRERIAANGKNTALTARDQELRRKIVEKYLRSILKDPYLIQHLSNYFMSSHRRQIFTLIRGDESAVQMQKGIVARARRSVEERDAEAQRLANILIENAETDQQKRNAEALKMVFGLLDLTQEDVLDMATPLVDSYAVEEWKAVESVLQDLNATLKLAEVPHAAYQRSEHPNEPDFKPAPLVSLDPAVANASAGLTVREEGVGINLAGFWAMVTALFSLKKNSTQSYADILDVIIRDEMDGRTRNYLMRKANQTWMASTVFKGIAARIKKKNFTVWDLLSDEDKYKDIVQIREAARILREEIGDEKDPAAQKQKVIALMRNAGRMEEIAGRLNDAYNENEKQKDPNYQPYPLYDPAAADKATSLKRWESDVATNMAGSYAVVTGVGNLREQPQFAARSFKSVLKEIAQGLKALPAVVLEGLERDANGTWISQIAFRGLAKRLAKPNATAWDDLPESEKAKDGDQVESVVSALLPMFEAIMGRSEIRGNVDIQIVLGDITRVKADAVVAGVPSEMAVGVGMTGAIIRMIGSRDAAFPTRRAQIGEAIPVSVKSKPNPAGWRYVISAVMHTWERSNPTPQEAEVRTAVQNALLEADKLGDVTSIAFPTFGTGNLGLDPRQAAKWMISAAKETIASGRLQHVKNITFVLRSPDSFAAFQAFAASESGKKARAEVRTPEEQKVLRVADGLGTVGQIRKALDSKQSAIVIGAPGSGKTELGVISAGKEPAQFDLPNEFWAFRHADRSQAERNQMWKDGVYFKEKADERRWMENPEVFEALFQRYLNNPSDTLMFDEIDLLAGKTFDADSLATAKKVMELAARLKAAGKKVIIIIHPAGRDTPAFMNALIANGLLDNAEQLIQTQFLSQAEEVTILQALGFSDVEASRYMSMAQGFPGAYFGFMKYAAKLAATQGAVPDYKPTLNDLINAARDIAARNYRVASMEMRDSTTGRVDAGKVAVMNLLEDLAAGLRKGDDPEVMAARAALLETGLVTIQDGKVVMPQVVRDAIDSETSKPMLAEGWTSALLPLQYPVNIIGFTIDGVRYFPKQEMHATLFHWTPELIAAISRSTGQTEAVVTAELRKIVLEIMSGIDFRVHRTGDYAFVDSVDSKGQPVHTVVESLRIDGFNDFYEALGQRIDAWAGKGVQIPRVVSHVTVLQSGVPYGIGVTSETMMRQPATKAEQDAITALRGQMRALDLGEIESTAKGLDDLMGWLRSNGTFSAADLKDIEESFVDAMIIHRTQRRREGAPYFMHLLRVVKRAVAFGVTDPYVIQSLALHDAIEDQPEAFQKVQERYEAFIAKNKNSGDAKLRQQSQRYAAVLAGVRIYTKEFPTVLDTATETGFQEKEEQLDLKYLAQLVDPRAFFPDITEDYMRQLQIGKAADFDDNLMSLRYILPAQTAGSRGYLNKTRSFVENFISRARYLGNADKQRILEIFKEDVQGYADMKENPEIAAIAADLAGWLGGFLRSEARAVTEAEKDVVLNLLRAFDNGVGSYYNDSDAIKFSGQKAGILTSEALLKLIQPIIEKADRIAKEIQQGIYHGDLGAKARTQRAAEEVSRKLNAIITEMQPAGIKAQADAESARKQYQETSARLAGELFGLAIGSPITLTGVFYTLTNGGRDLATRKDFEVQGELSGVERTADGGTKIHLSRITKSTGLNFQGGGSITYGGKYGLNYDSIAVKPRTARESGSTAVPNSLPGWQIESMMHQPIFLNLVLLDEELGTDFQIRFRSQRFDSEASDVTTKLSGFLETVLREINGKASPQVPIARTAFESALKKLNPARSEVREAEEQNRERSAMMDALQSIAYLFSGSLGRRLPAGTNAEQVKELWLDVRTHKAVNGRDEYLGQQIAKAQRFIDDLFAADSQSYLSESLREALGSIPGFENLKMIATGLNLQKPENRIEAMVLLQALTLGNALKQFLSEGLEEARPAARDLLTKLNNPERGSLQGESNRDYRALMDQVRIFVTARSEVRGVQEAQAILAVDTVLDRAIKRLAYDHPKDQTNQLGGDFLMQDLKIGQIGMIYLASGDIAGALSVIEEIIRDMASVDSRTLETFLKAEALEQGKEDIRLVIAELGKAKTALSQAETKAPADVFVNGLPARVQDQLAKTAEKILQIVEMMPALVLATLTTDLQEYAVDSRIDSQLGNILRAGFVSKGVGFEDEGLASRLEAEFSYLRATTDPEAFKSAIRETVGALKTSLDRAISARVAPTAPVELKAEVVTLEAMPNTWGYNYQKAVVSLRTIDQILPEYYRMDWGSQLDFKVNGRSIKSDEQLSTYLAEIIAKLDQWQREEPSKGFGYTRTVADQIAQALPGLRSLVRAEAKPLVPATTPTVAARPVVASTMPAVSVNWSPVVERMKGLEYLSKLNLEQEPVEVELLGYDGKIIASGIFKSAVRDAMWKQNIVVQKAGKNPTSTDSVIVTSIRYRSTPRSEVRVTLQDFAQALETRMTASDVEVLKDRKIGDISLDKADTVTDVAVKIAFVVHGILELSVENPEEAADRMTALALALGANITAAIKKALPKDHVLPVSNSFARDIRFVSGATYGQFVEAVKVMLLLNPKYECNFVMPDAEAESVRANTKAFEEWASEQKLATFNISGRIHMMVETDYMAQQAHDSKNPNTVFSVSSADQNLFRKVRFEALRNAYMFVDLAIDARLETASAATATQIKLALKIGSIPRFASSNPVLRAEMVRGLEGFDQNALQRGSIAITNESLKSVLVRIWQEFQSVAQTAIAA